MCWGKHIYIYNGYSICKSSPPEVLSWKGVPKNTKQTHRRTPTLKCDPNKAAMQLYWSHTPTRALPHKSTAQIPKTPCQKSTLKGLHPRIFKNPNKFEVIISAKFQKHLTSFSVSSSFDLTFLENKLQELICFSLVFKNLFYNFGPLKEIEYFVLFKEHFFKLKFLCEKFVGCLYEGFLNIPLNINGATLLLTLCIKLRCWYKLIW